MKILAFSDLHGNAEHAAKFTAASAQADLVIAAGDFCNFHRGLPEAFALLAPITCPILAVSGNHETVAAMTSAKPKNMTILHGTSTEIDGVTFFGIGYGIPETPFDDWSKDLSEAEAEALLAPCRKADILISHSPPKGVADVTSKGESVGSTALHAATNRLQPHLFLCGHIHEAWGQTGRIGATQVHNLGPTINWFEV